MLQLNQTYKWTDIVNHYPDKWAVLTDVVRADGEIKTCKLLAICSKEEKNQYYDKYLGTNIEFQIVRTTWKGPNIGYF